MCIRDRDEADAGPSGDLGADNSSNIETNEVEQEKPEETPVEEEPMEAEFEKEDEKPHEPAPERDVTEKEDVEPAKDAPTKQEQTKVVDGSLEQTTEDKQDSAQEQVVPDQKPEELTSTRECKTDDDKSVETAEIETDKPTEEPTKEPTPTEAPAEVEIQEDLKQAEIQEVCEEKIAGKEQVASTEEIEKLSTEGKNENDVKNVEDTSQQTKEKVEVTNGQSDTKHLPSTDATAVIESPQKVDSQSPGVISVGTN
ncbi:neuromodulin-like [Anneissia japonica]|uniref:neuromodulin-like n=1 Tax=Anneissia japonica TaxID=1529436 RepID=UPI0014255D2F|nr:neuromodulin-like [Anneissia japonica]